MGVENSQKKCEIIFEQPLTSNFKTIVLYFHKHREPTGLRVSISGVGFTLVYLIHNNMSMQRPSEAFRQFAPVSGRLKTKVASSQQTAQSERVTHYPRFALTRGDPCTLQPSTCVVICVVCCVCQCFRFHHKVGRLCDEK